jgi:leucyl aminopeptidase (aminopeptidase T)
MSVRVAHAIVSDCLRIRPDDVVTVNTWAHTIELSDAILEECYRIGADAMAILDTDRSYYSQMETLSEENLKVTSKHCLGTAEYSTVNIFIGGPANPLRMRKIPPGKFAALFEGEKGHEDKSREKKIRSAFLEQGMVTPERARTYGFNFQRWKRMTDSATAIRYDDMSILGRRVTSNLERAREVRVRSRIGTDLRFSILGRQAQINDGIIDDDDIRRGALFTALPTGSVTVSVVEDSASGKISFDLPIPQVGRLIHGLQWIFENGHVTSYNAEKNVDAFGAIFEKAHGDKDKIASLTIGLNPRVRTGFLNDSLAKGTVSIGIGSSLSIGGKNNSDYGFRGTLSQATVELDGRTIVENGRIVV